MRNELQHIEKIEQYITGALSDAETAAFEKEMAQNTNLVEQVNQQKLLQQAALRKAIRADVLKYGGTGGFAWGKWMSILGVSVLVVALVWYAIQSFSAPSKSSSYIPNDSENVQLEKEKPVALFIQDSTIIDSTEVLDSLKTVEGTHQNKSALDYTYDEDTHCDGLKTYVKPDIQEFKVDPSKGKTIEGEDGTLIIVPTDAFVNEDGSLVKEEVKLELVEALKISDMLAYNLTTMNDENALQTGGMIYVQPYVNEKKVNINPERPLYIEIPTDDYNPDMMAWQGETNASGDINWVSPTSLKKYLTLVDFENLDFLPTGFEDAVAAGMPFKGHTIADKELVDSLYYSIGVKKEKIEISKAEVVSDDEAFRSKKRGLKIGARDFSLGKKSLNGKTVLIGQVQNQFGQTPKDASIMVFQNNKFNKKDILTDENGRFVFNKLETGQYIITANDKQGNYLTSKLYISKGEDSIRIIDQLILTPANTNFANSKLGSQPNNKINQTEGKTQNSNIDSESCYISPQSIQTIKSPTFAKSFLATKEFEERLRILHQMPNAQVLFDLYINNLEKDLHEVDAMVAAKLSGTNKKYFTDFAAQKLTNVLNVNIYQDQLSNYYNNKKSEYSKAQQEAQNAYTKKSTKELKQYQQQLIDVVTKYNKLDNMQSLASSNQVTSLSTVIRSPRSSKFNISLPIGRNKLPKNNNVATSRNSYATPWYSGGWMNIDAYLHMINKNPVEITIDTGKDKKQKGAKIYQFLNTLKTIIPITIIGGIGKAKFPKAGTQGAVAMKNPFAIGIHKSGGKIFYAEEKYNPYSLNEVDMRWSEVSEAMLMENLQKLDGTGPLIKEVNAQQKLITQQLKIKEQKADLKIEMDSIQAKIAIIEKALAIENAFINSLKKVVDKCGVDHKMILEFSEKTINTKIELKPVVKDSTRAVPWP